MSLCPICSKVYCDHSLEERQQTQEEMDAPLTPEEQKRWVEKNRFELARVQAIVEKSKPFKKGKES